MISAAPVQAAANLPNLAEQVKAFLVVAKAKAADGLTFAEFGELLVALLRLSVETLDAVNTMSGADKKALVLEAVASLFDTVADKCVPLPLWPVWMLARPAVRSLVLALAAGAVDPLLQLVRKGA